MSHVIRVVGIVGQENVSAPPLYCKDFDHDKNDFMGDMKLTPWIQRAKRFATADDAMLFWNKISTTRPVRPDGKPNKPMTAYTIQVMPLPAEKKRLDADALAAYASSRMDEIRNFVEADAVYLIISRQHTKDDISHAVLASGKASPGDVAQGVGKLLAAFVYRDFGLGIAVDILPVVMLNQVLESMVNSADHMRTAKNFGEGHDAKNPMDDKAS